MEEDIQKYSPTVMFRGTPCITTEIVLRATSTIQIDDVKCDRMFKTLGLS